MDEQTAGAIEIGGIGIGGFGGIALADDGSLFGSLGFRSNGQIVQIDPSSGARIDIGLSGFQAVPALDFHPDGTLYGIGRICEPDCLDFLITIFR